MTTTRRPTLRRPTLAALAGLTVLGSLPARPAVAQLAARAPVRAVSLQDALQLGEARSEAVQIARAGVMRAEGQALQARSQYLPQLSGSAQYQRTLKSQFSALTSTAAPPVPPPGTPPVPAPDPTTYYQPCSRYLPQDPAAPVAQRLAQLEQFARCQAAGGGGGINFSKVGFGAANQYSLGLAGSWTVYSGGRVQAQNAAARAGQRSADVELAAQRAQVTLTVAQAYFDAVLGDRLLAIAESSLAQTELTLRQTQLTRQVGNTSEFELLRAQVTRDNQRPQVIQVRTQRDLAHLQLKQLLDLPLDEPVTLTTDLQEAGATAGTVAGAVAVAGAADTSSEARAPVREAAQMVIAQQEQLRVARAERLPSLALSTQYGRVAFPASGVPSWNDFLTNWTVSIAASVPLFTGGRLRGDELIARANLVEAQQRLQQTRELASLDARRALAALQQAQATFEASRGTGDQASRAYQIAEIRYREGISTQLELSESRLLLQQAQAMRAQAARDLQVARLRLALLRDLPLSAGGAMPSPSGAGGAPTGSAPGGAAPSPQQPITPRATSAITGTGPGR